MTDPNHRRIVTIAHAHTATQSYVFVDLTGVEPTGSVHLPIADVARILEFQVPGSDDLESSLEPQIDSAQEYVLGHLEIALDSVEQQIRFSDWRILPHGDSPYLVLEFRLDGVEAKTARSLEVRFDAVIEHETAREGLLVLQMPRGWGFLSSMADTHHPLDNVKTSHQLLLEFPTWPQNLASSFAEAVRRVWRPSRRLVGRMVRAVRPTGTGDAHRQ